MSPISCCTCRVATSRLPSKRRDSDEAGSAPGAGEPPAPVVAPPTAEARSRPRFGFVRDLLRNLGAAAALARLRRRSLDAWRADGIQLIGLFLLNLAAGLAYDIYAAYPGPGRFDWDALPGASFWALPLLLSAWLIAHLGRPADAGRLMLPMAVAGFALAALGSFASTALAVLADFFTPIDRFYQWLIWVPVLWVALGWAFGAPRLAGLRGGRAVVAAVLAAALVVGPQWTADAGARLWVAAADDPGSDASSQNGAAAEQVLYAQTDLLDTGDRSIVLANSQKHAGETPFATVTALQRALATIAQRMDEGEDILFLFLTSHGSPDHRLDVSLAPYQLEPLTPVRLRALLDESGIRFRVIVVSACYSGGFVRTLASPDTLVITASGADRASFGCRDGRQWTDFGRAYFKEALPATGSFEGALQRARELIAQREAAAKLTPSEPQIFVGDAIRERLQSLQTQRLGSHLRSRARAHGCSRCWPPWLRCRSCCRRRCWAFTCCCCWGRTGRSGGSRLRSDWERLRSVSGAWCSPRSCIRCRSWCSRCRPRSPWSAKPRWRRRPVCAPDRSTGSFRSPFRWRAPALWPRSCSDSPTWSASSASC